MNEEQAKMVAGILGGEAYNSGGGCWVVRIFRSNGSMVLISKDVVASWDSQEDYEQQASPIAEVDLYV